MNEAPGILNDAGRERFVEWLAAAKAGGKDAPPAGLLTDPAYASPAFSGVAIDREPGGAPFCDRYVFGLYLSEAFSALPRTDISRNHELWNWLSLYYIDQLAPPMQDGTRKILDLEVYALDKGFNFRKYYRHAVRTAWLAATEHGLFSRVLLIPAGRAKPGTGVLAHGGEIIEQIASRQWALGSRSIVEGTGILYMDPKTSKPKRGSGGSNRGSPRRLAAVIQQLELTYDLRDCSATEFIALLPKEFDRWKNSEATTQL